jgi:Na+/proline symporter
MSDIGILNDPFSLVAIALIFGSPGLLLGAIAGGLWRGHRIGGALLGGIAGFILWLTGWMWLKDVI